MTAGATFTPLPSLERKLANSLAPRASLGTPYPSPWGGTHFPVSGVQYCTRPSWNPSLSPLDLTSSKPHPSQWFTAEWLPLCQTATGTAVDLCLPRLPWHRFHSGNRRRAHPPEGLP